MIALPDYSSIEHDIQRAVERWENEGGWSIYADFTKARERENNGAPPSGEGAAETRAHRTTVTRAGRSSSPFQR